jgi:hypothetical protein
MNPETFDDLIAMLQASAKGAYLSTLMDWSPEQQKIWRGNEFTQ